MVALVVRAPRIVVPYFTNEFYASNHSLRERMDVLDVLIDGAKHIANGTNPASVAAAAATAAAGGGASAGAGGRGKGVAGAGVGVTEGGRLFSSTIPRGGRGGGEQKGGGEEGGEGGAEGEGVMVAATEEVETAEEKRQRREKGQIGRVIRRSRVVGEGGSSSRRGAKLTKCMFGDIAGLFMFPLIRRFDVSEGGGLDMMARDHGVLSRLLYALGIFVECSGHHPLTPRLARELGKVSASLRYHSQAAVRRSVLWTVSRILITAPPALLMAGYVVDLVDLKTWLRDVGDTDSDALCREQARALAALLSGGAGGAGGSAGRT